jgi:4-hydroxybenzoate polyprenyltransferase
MREKLHALLATARIANVPSVVSNVFVGIALAVSLGAVPNSERSGAILIVSGISLYLAGNFLNDWWDRNWDATRRPERALPRGLFPPALYLAISAGFGFLGLGLAALVRTGSFTVALNIVCLILLYTGIHKRSTWSVVPMGLCRALLPALGFFGLMPPENIKPWISSGTFFALAACGFALFCHIAGLSLSARNESLDRAPYGLPRFAWCLFPLAALSLFPVADSFPLAFLPYGIWISLCLTVFRKPVSRHVSMLLAGIPLVDWIALLPLTMTMETGWSPLWIACLTVPPLAFLSALALQRLTPAT